MNPGKTRLRNSALVSALSACFGWLALNAFLFPIISLRQRLCDEGDWFMVAVLCGVSAAFTFGASVLILLPALLFARLTSRLLRWPMLGAAGGIAGATVLLCYGLIAGHSLSRESIVFCLGVGGFTGAATGVCASLLMQRSTFNTT
jgi:hypothetical protein